MMSENFLPKTYPFSCSKLGRGKGEIAQVIKYIFYKKLTVNLSVCGKGENFPFSDSFTFQAMVLSSVSRSVSGHKHGV